MDPTIDETAPQDPAAHEPTPEAAPTAARESTADARDDRTTIDLRSAHPGQPSPWADLATLLDGHRSGNGGNIAHEAVDRHVLDGNGDRAALRIVDGGSEPQTITYAQLSELSNRFANVLRELGVRRGDTVAVLLDASLDLHVAVLGALKHRCTVAPLFTSLGPEPLRVRLAAANAVCLVTTGRIYDRKLTRLRPRLPALRHVLLAGMPEDRPPTATVQLQLRLDQAPSHYGIGRTDPGDAAFVHFTSGTTGSPKGVVHGHDLALGLLATGRLALDLRPTDRMWCTADAGWIAATGLGGLLPMLCGATAVLTRGSPALHAHRVLRDEQVTVWYTTPTMLREVLAQHRRPLSRFPHLRLALSTGEPLDPDLATEVQRRMGILLRDSWGQTETGTTLVASRPPAPVRPGSMGTPLPGITVSLARCDADGHVRRGADGTVDLLGGAGEGMLVVEAGWPGMFRGYLGASGRYDAAFATAGGRRWYLTGDLVRRDVYGGLWFVARTDEVIRVDDHLVGPAEIERVLVGHPDVADAGVYITDEQGGRPVVHAVVVLQPGVTDRSTMRRAIAAYAHAHLGSTLAPQVIHVATGLPRTRSGKLLRRVLGERHAQGLVVRH